MDNNMLCENPNIVDSIMKAGIVGAGGAGFPTHVKLSAKAQVVIANGVECEPLLETDRNLMLREPEKVIEGLRLAMRAVGAETGIIAIKTKNKHIIEHIRGHLSHTDRIQIRGIDNFYPAGDEHVLVYETIKKVVPMSGIPIDVGVVVDNVYTLALIAEAVRDRCFTHRYVTINGEVVKPCVARLPLGMSIREAIEKAAGGFKSYDCKVVIGGPMMGRIESNLDKPIEKTTGGILVFPSNHKVIRLKSSIWAREVKRARSACCQCNICTDMCPRFLLGHKIQPHKLMRLLSGIDNTLETDCIAPASLCSDCGLCSSFACTMGLSPNKVNSYFKDILRERGYKSDYKSRTMSPVNEFRELRKVPVNRLIDRLGISDYDNHLQFCSDDIVPERIVLPLKQHIGMSSVPVVDIGEKVSAGQQVAAIPKGKTGACLHTPFDGTVVEVSENIVINTSRG